MTARAWTISFTSSAPGKDRTKYGSVSSYQKRVRGPGLPVNSFARTGHHGLTIVQRAFYGCGLGPLDITTARYPRDVNIRDQVLEAGVKLYMETAALSGPMFLLPPRSFCAVAFPSQCRLTDSLVYLSGPR